ncbi:MAG TPA: DUF3237 family protein, partial [Polyangiaceae bacterium]
QSNDNAAGIGGAASSATGAGGNAAGGKSASGGTVGTSSSVGSPAGGVGVTGGTVGSSSSERSSGGAQVTTASTVANGGTASSSVSTSNGSGGRTTTTSSSETGGKGVGGRATGGATSAAAGGSSSGGTSASVAIGGGVSRGGTNSNGGSTSDSAGSNSGGGSGVGDATIVPDPSWTCGMPDGIPSPTSGTLVFKATLQLGATHDVGNTQFGHRRILDVKGGSLKGDRVEATVMNLGLDLELTLSNGSIELEQINILKASDGTLIYMRNCGVAAAGDKAVRVVADFEVPTGKSLAWLNSGKYVGTRVVDAAAGTLQLDVYDVSKVAISEPKVQLKDPAGVPNVSWDCVSATGTNGATVFTENVTLGSSVSIGASKRGSRNIIPITGGTTTGKVAGAILPGGGDYQLSGLDARYTLAPSDGEFILVRNCGPMSGLVPVFEARADGPYAFLNANKFLSSAPGSASGGVSITFYERK